MPPPCYALHKWWDEATKIVLAGQDFSILASSLWKKIYGTGCSVESITIDIWATLGIIHGYEID